ncbi:hypothetical protein [Natronomonas sp.]|uniref:hypothetical protein n=1 Tax=Natronomonas sp. TaxID=2184060 RepID=UPI002FC29E48
MDRRRFLAACGLGIGGVAGCLDGSVPGGSENPTDDAPSSPSGTPPDDPPPHEDAMNEPDPDLDVGIENRSDETQTITLTVSRESGEIVYEETHAVEPGSDIDVYNLEEADPDGIEEFAITAERDGQRESATVKTSKCYGNAFVSIAEDGECYVTYSIC